MTQLSTAVGPIPVGLCLVALGLAGCAPTGYPVFDADQTRDDRLPRAIIDTLELADFDLSTARWAGSHHGVDFYVLQPSEGAGPCIAVADGTGSSISCGSDGRVEITTREGVEVRLAPVYDALPDGWTAISDNVRVRE